MLIDKRNALRAKRLAPNESFCTLFKLQTAIRCQKGDFFLQTGAGYFSS